MSVAEKIKAVPQLVEERGAVYGHPSVDFNRVSKIKSVLSACTDDELRHVLEMIAVKMSRLVETPDHDDSWVDIAGYAMTAAMVLDRRRQDQDQIDFGYIVRSYREMWDAV